MYISFYKSIAQPKQYQQITIDYLLHYDEPTTLTTQTTTKPIVTLYKPQLTDTEKQNLYRKYNIPHMVRQLKTFKKGHEKLLKENMSEHYTTFNIPKRTGGLRTINAPKPQLMSALRDLKILFDDCWHILPHNAAHAYVKQRGTLTALNTHKANDSYWFLKLDLKHFFNSCNFNFIKTQLKQVFPFNFLYEEIPEDLDFIIKLCLLNNELPQGTPVSPILTNILMVPIDYAIQKLMSTTFEGRLIYTRYADDLLISSRTHFITEKDKVITEIMQILKNTPLYLNTEKTRYGSSAGRNWNLGLMYNKDHEITVGHKNKKRLKAMIHNFLKDLTNGTHWDIMDLQSLLGHINYQRHIAPDYTDYILQQYSTKENNNRPVLQTIVQEIKAQTV